MFEVEEIKAENDAYNRDFRHDKDINEIDDAIAKMHSRHPRNDRQSAKLQSMQVGSKPLSERKMHELQIEDHKSPNTLSEEQ